MIRIYLFIYLLIYLLTYLFTYLSEVQGLCLPVISWPNPIPSLQLTFLAFLLYYCFHVNNLHFFKNKSLLPSFLHTFTPPVCTSGNIFLSSALSYSFFRPQFKYVFLWRRLLHSCKLSLAVPFLCSPLSTLYLSI